MSLEVSDQYIDVTCPHCHGRLEVDADVLLAGGAGEVVEHEELLVCGYCGQEFEYRARPALTWVVDIPKPAVRIIPFVGRPA